MDDIPILTDNDGETSIEQDVEEKFHKKITSNRTTPNATNTLFNITFENFDDGNCEDVVFKDYECRLRQNKKDWKSLYLNACKDLKQSKQKHPVVDKNILSPDKLKYLGHAINLQNFIRESLEFRHQATLFLEYEYAEFTEIQRSFEDLYERKINLIKTNKTAKKLADE